MPRAALPPIEEMFTILPRPRTRMCADTACKQKKSPLVLTLWIQSHCLGELGSLQVSVGQSAEARASVEEALRIDHPGLVRVEHHHGLAEGEVRSISEGSFTTDRNGQPTAAFRPLLCGNI